MNEDQLDTVVTRQGYSRRDVLDFVVGEVDACTFNTLTIDAVADEYNNGFYALSLAGRRYISASGTGWSGLHGRRGWLGGSRRVESGIWFFEFWAGNYFHWIARCLPKAYVLSRMFPDMPLLVPSHAKLCAFQIASLKALQLFDRLLYLPAERVEVSECAVICGADTLNPFLLKELRGALGIPDSVQGLVTKLYASRAGAHWRKVVNESDVRERLGQNGFEVCDFGSMDFQRQVALCRSSCMLAGAHGAGLTNMIFLPTGSTVVEVAEPSYPNPDYYLLASVLGHRYVLMEAEAASMAEPGWQDIVLPVERLLNLLPSD